MEGRKVLHGQKEESGETLVVIRFAQRDISRTDPQTSALAGTLPASGPKLFLPRNGYETAFSVNGLVTISRQEGARDLRGTATGGKRLSRA